MGFQNILSVVLEFLQFHRRGKVLRCLIFVALAVVAYWPAFFSERIWDDHFLVDQNPFFRSLVLAPEAFRHWLYPFSVSAYFRPIQNLSYMMDYWVWSENLFGYHLTNTLLHAAAALLLAILIHRIANVLAPERHARNSLLALGTGMIWLVHPIHHAAVAYTAGRADSLAAIFALLGWLLAERGMEDAKRGAKVAYFIGAAFSCALALFSKEIAITWIALFVVYQLFFQSGHPKRLRSGVVLGVGAIVLLYFLYRLSLPPLAENGTGSAAAPFAVRVVQAARALGDYLSIVLLPVNLHMERQLHAPTDVLRASAPWLYYHALALLPLSVGGVAAGLWLCLRRGVDRRLHIFACCWFLVGFLPISNLFPLNAPVAEHWIYMPSAALILLLVKGLLTIPVPNPATRLGALGGMMAMLAILTHEQSRTWVTEEGMFRITIARGGDSARIRANFARVLASKGRRDEAEGVLREGLARDPGHSMLTDQLTALLQISGRINEALEYAHGKVLASQMNGVRRATVPWIPYLLQIRLFLVEERTEEAQEVLNAALAHWPHAWDIISLQALGYAQAGKPELSVVALRGYLQKNWWHRDAIINLAQYLAQLQRYDEAVNEYRLAGRLDIHSAKPWEQISAIRFQQGRLPEALVAQEKAVRVEPKSVEQRLRLAALYSTLGNEVDALIERQTAADLRKKGG